MGYYTSFDITVSGFKEEEHKEYFEFKLYKEDEFWSSNWVDQGKSFTKYLDSAKWYSWQKDLEDFSKEFPKLLFEVEGWGEESGDIWRARVKDGKTEVVKAKLVFPEFKEILK